jgi:DNA-binding transcriptional LysR family regulator
MADFQSLSLFELDLLSSLQTHESLRSIAAFRDLQAPHISKIISRIEEKVGTKLILRSPKGFILTPDGLRFSHVAANILTAAQDLTIPQDTSKKRRPTLISIATTGFIATNLIAPVLESWRQIQENTLFRLLAMNPDEIVSSGIVACDVLVSTSTPTLPKTWDIEDIGGITWGLFSSPFHPLSGTVSSADVKNYPFLVPTYWNGNGYEIGDDFCPLPWTQRYKGDEISNVHVGLEIVCSSPHQLIYAPKLAASQYLTRGDLKELKVQGWKDIDRILYVASRSDKISLKFKTQLIGSIRKKLGR